MTKALQLARSFHSAGHRVVLVESAKYRFTGHRFSRAVAAFHCVPEPAAPGYAEALLDVVRRERVDVFVPVSSPAGSVHDARARRLLDGVCEVIHADTDTVKMLDDKAEFSKTAGALGLRVPDWRRITDPRQVEEFDFPRERSYILKRIAYNPVGRTRPDSAVERDSGAEFRVRAVAAHLPGRSVDPAGVRLRPGVLHARRLPGAAGCRCTRCCESSASQLNYTKVDKPEIRPLGREFRGQLGVTGQVSFDFIESADGDTYAIECNPRTHSAITMFHDHPEVARPTSTTATRSSRPVPAPARHTGSTTRCGV